MGFDENPPADKQKKQMAMTTDRTELLLHRYWSKLRQTELSDRATLSPPEDVCACTCASTHTPSWFQKQEGGREGWGGVWTRGLLSGRSGDLGSVCQTRISVKERNIWKQRNPWKAGSLVGSQIKIGHTGQGSEQKNHSRESTNYLGSWAAPVPIHTKNIYWVPATCQALIKVLVCSCFIQNNESALLGRLTIIKL